MLVQEHLRENFPRHHTETELLLLEIETNMGVREFGADIPCLEDHPYSKKQSLFLNMAPTSASLKMLQIKA